MSENILNKSEGLWVFEKYVALFVVTCIVVGAIVEAPMLSLVKIVKNTRG